MSLPSRISNLAVSKLVSATPVGSLAPSYFLLGAPTAATGDTQRLSDAAYSAGIVDCVSLFSASIAAAASANAASAARRWSKVGRPDQASIGRAAPPAEAIAASTRGAMPAT